MPFRGEERQRRRLAHHEPADELVRRRRQGSRGRTGARRAPQSSGWTTSPDSTSGPTGCSRNSNDVTTPKLPPPPRIAQNRSGCSVSLARTRLAVGQYHFGRDQIVDREPEAPAQPAEPAAERESRNAGGGVDPERRRQAVRPASRAIELAQCRPALDPRASARRVDLDRLHRREIDHQPAIAERVAGDVMSAAANGEDQIVPPGEAAPPARRPRRWSSGRRARAGDRSSRSRWCGDPLNSGLEAAYTRPGRLEARSSIKSWVSVTAICHLQFENAGRRDRRNGATVGDADQSANAALVTQKGRDIPPLRLAESSTYS